MFYVEYPSGAKTEHEETQVRKERCSMHWCRVKRIYGNRKAVGEQTVR